METVHYLNNIRSHLATIVAMGPYTPKSLSKLKPALLFRYSIVIPRSIILALKLFNPNNHYQVTSHPSIEVCLKNITLDLAL